LPARQARGVEGGEVAGPRGRWHTGTPLRITTRSSPVRIMARLIVLDAADIDSEAAFWASVLGGTVRASAEGSAYPDWRDVQVDGEIVLGVQLAPDHVRPQW